MIRLAGFLAVIPFFAILKKNEVNPHEKIEPIPPSLPLLTKGEFYLEDEEIFSGLLINGGNQSYLDAKNMVLRESHIQNLRCKNRFTSF